MSDSQYRGTPLRHADFVQKKVLTHRTDPDLSYRWAAGLAIGKYLDGFKQGKIIASHCGTCDRTVVPPRSFCEVCFKPTGQYVEVPQTGTVNTFVISWIATDRSRLKKPLLPAVVDLDGTTNAGILHFVANIAPEKLRIGLKVKAVWKPKSERVGDVRDLKHFVPRRS